MASPLKASEEITPKQLSNAQLDAEPCDGLVSVLFQHCSLPALKIFRP
jgi:hypothetical protein